MADALRTELEYGVSDRFGANFLARVSYRMEAGLARSLENALVCDAGVADLLAAEADTDDAVVRMPRDIAEEVA